MISYSIINLLHYFQEMLTKVASLRFKYLCHHFRFSAIYDVVVIGGGHAGCEAAYAAARTGANTVLITQKKSTIGQMSCNPSMGGIGKGHLMRQIDALGGLVGKISDLSALQFKVLNSSKGEAVQGPRAQIDRDIYKNTMLRQLEQTQNLSIKQMSVQDFQIDESQKRIKTIHSKNGDSVSGKSFILTTGTFLRGMIHIGKKSYPAGRHLRDSSQTQPPSIGLAETLKRLKFPISRMTTGTPPRLDAKTIDFSLTQVQQSDNPIQPFSFVHQWQNFQPKHQLINCYRTQTNIQTHKVIQDHRSQLPVFQGNSGKGLGPRYCPAIQKKVIRFPDKKSHQVWLQPEGIKSNVIYPNGLNNGFPQQIQLKLLRTIPALRNVSMIRPGYAVQYDYIDPKHMKHTLKSEILVNLFLAGQINGTTGYQQAAAQGIIAGINAGLYVQNRPPFIIDRTKAYIGVLIDDLITQGVMQPYRMFTSRSQYRLVLRPSNADVRLTGQGIKLGIISKKQEQIFTQKLRSIQKALQLLDIEYFSLNQWSKKLPNKDIKQRPMNKTASQMISAFDIKIKDLSWIKGIDSRVQQYIQSQLKYQAYTRKIMKEIQAIKESQYLQEVSDINFQQYKRQFTSEQYEILVKNQPKTMNAASRLHGIRPSTLLYLNYLFNKHRLNNQFKNYSEKGQNQVSQADI